MSPQASEHRSIALMLGSALFFATNILVLRGLSLAVPAADGWVASWFRGAVGLAIVAIFFGGRGLQVGRLFTRPLLIFRGLLGGAAILAFYLTIVHLGAGRATIINLSYPMFGSLIASLVLKEHLSARAWGWMSAGFGGLVVFLGGGEGRALSVYDGIALAGAVAAGAVVVLIRQLRHSEHTSTIYASQCLATLAIALVPATPTVPTLPTPAIALLALAGVLVAGGQLALTHAFRTLSVARGSSIQMLLPIATALGGFLFFGERFTPTELAGAALTLLATWRILGERRRPVAASVAGTAVRPKQLPEN